MQGAQAPGMSKMLQVRNVPEPVHRVLRERAARRGKSLSASRRRREAAYSWRSW